MLEVRRDITIQAPVSVVWSYFTQVDRFREWFSADIQIDLAPGGKHKSINGEGKQSITGNVMAHEPMKRMGLTWFEENSDWVNPIFFDFLLSARGDSKGTHVTFVIHGFEQIGNKDYRATYRAYEEGTDRHHILENLKDAVSRASS